MFSNDLREGPEGVKWDWDLPVFSTGKWDFLCWEWDFCHWEWEREHQMGVGFNVQKTFTMLQTASIFKKFPQITTQSKSGLSS